MLIASFLPEARSSEAESILQAADAILISALTRTEFLIALDRLRKVGTLSEYQQDLLTVTLEGLIEDGILQLIPLEAAHFALAASLARRSPVVLKTLDAVHLAVVHRLGCRLATFDIRLAEAARTIGTQLT